MRNPALLVILLALGCGTQQAAPPPGRRAEAKPPAAPPREAKPAPAGRPGSDWPGFLGPKGDSTSPEKGILSPWPENGLRIVWRKRVGAGYGMPAVVGKHLYQFDRHGDRARLSCLDRLTGGEVWKFEYPTDYRDSFGYDNGPRCCPVVDGDRVYIHGAEGMLHCVRATDGKPLWKVDTFQQFNVVPNFFGVGSTPVVEGDLLIVQVGGSPKGSDADDFQKLKGNGSGVVAFDKKTGKVKYRITDELASY
ncbi:MAG TPA: PQQ-binding-like beta-propeller repeat protein, partial [Gemmataceae bacterium]|nr:PQQ-binding-like beta-propeller repeat protein [Gemmataceae bacterium]